MSKLSKFPAWLFTLIAAAILIVITLGALDFIHRWHSRGDAFAQAEGTLFTFFASGISVLVTLVFIYLTRRSVEAAQDAIQVQKESLRAAEDAIKLEREKWELQLRVEPRIWLAKSTDIDRQSYVNYGVDERGRGSADLVPQVMCYVWNPGQQSFRVSSVALRLSEDQTFFLTETVPDMVVAPHSIDSFDVTRNLVALLFDHRAPQVQYRRGAHIKPFAIVAAEVSFDSWMNRVGEANTVQAHFRVQTDSGIEEITIHHI